MNKSSLMLAASALSVPRALVATGVFATPRADAQNPQALLEELQRSVAALRSEQEGAIDRRVDALTTEKIGAIQSSITNLESALDELATRAAASAPPIVGDIQGNPEYVTNFKAHMRQGEVNAAMSIGTAADGGFLAPVEWDRTITRALTTLSPIRANAQVITISGQGFSRLYASGQPGSGWVGETAARPQTATPQLSQLAFTIGELYANPAITQTALDDAAIDLEAWLADEVQTEFARQEGIAFLSGDGVNKPHGLLNYVTGAADAARHPFGAIESVDAGVALDADDILNLIYQLPAERVTENTKLFMNRQVEASLRTLKDANGQYLWQPRLTEGVPSTFAGEPIVHIGGMPVDGAGNVVALYGDMRATYLVIDRIGVRVLRDPYTNKPFVMFYTTKRVGGGVQNPEFMKALKRA